MRTIIVLEMMPKREVIRTDPKVGGKAWERTPRQVSSDELLRGAAELVIVHGGREYRLRVTQNGKLILTA